MSLIAAALQTHIAQELVGVLQAPRKSFHELVLGRNGFYPIPAPGSPWEWEFDFLDAVPVGNYLASECARFSCAAFQTFAGVSQDLQSRTQRPWALIRMYYAAFYAAHAIYRLLGRGCSHVAGDVAADVRQVLDMYGINRPFSSGLYSTYMVGSTLRMRHVGSQGGGSHETFWALFAEKLTRLEAQVLGGPLPHAEAQQVFVVLGQLRGILTKNGCAGNWLSTVRNSIQYKHTIGPWFPDAFAQGTLGKVASRWKMDPLETSLVPDRSGDIGQFVAGSTFLVAACHSLLQRLERLGGGRRTGSLASCSPLTFVAQFASAA